MQTWKLLACTGAHDCGCAPRSLAHAPHTTFKGSGAASVESEGSFGMYVRPTSSRRPIERVAEVCGAAHAAYDGTKCGNACHCSPFAPQNAGCSLEVDVCCA